MGDVSKCLSKEEMYEIVELQKWAGWSRLPLSREEDCVVTANLGDFLYMYIHTPTSSRIDRRGSSMHRRCSLVTQAGSDQPVSICSQAGGGTLP